MKAIHIIFPVMYFFVLSLLFPGCEENTPNQDQEVLTGAYFNEEFPSATVTRFAPNVFTEELHAPPIFSPDGQEVYWSFMNSQGIRCMKLTGDVWSNATAATFSLGGGDDSPFISSDGTKLVFLSRYNSTKENIWMVEKTNGAWGSSRKLAHEVNQFAAHWQASIADNLNLYFGSDGDIFFSEYVNGDYTTAQKLDSSINTEDGYEGSPFIAPDESYLILDRAAPYADLLISFKQDDGSWSNAVPMVEINTGGHDLYANVSPDGRFIMFLSSRSGILLPHWIDASIIDNYRPSSSAN
jgi:hypothetical protein